TLSAAPTLPHTGTWAGGSLTWNQSNASLYINPASAVADSNILGIAVAGSVKVSIDAEGDIYARNLILTGSTSTGTTTVAGDLTVEGNTILGDAPTDTLTFNASTLAIPNNLNIDSNTLFVDSTNNRVSMGTATAVFSDDVTAGPGLIIYDANGTFASRLELGSTTTASNSAFGRIVFSNKGTSNVDKTLALIDARLDASVADYGSWLSFYTKLAGGSLAERVRIDTDGDVGIGTASPTSFLHVDGAATTTILSAFARSFVDNTNAITTNTGNTAVYGLMIDEPNILLGTVTPTNSASLYVSGAATEASNNFAIYSSSGKNYFGGNVGIGITTPLFPLHVVGPIQSDLDASDHNGFRSGGLVTDFINTAPAYGMGLSDDTDLSGGAGNAIQLSGYFGLQFLTGNTRNMVILSSGLVGIGTIAPDAALEINHATGDSLRLTYNDADGTATNYTDFSLSSTGAMTFTGSAATLAASATAEKTFLTLTPGIITLTAPTAVTSLMETSVFTGVTIAADAATTVNKATTLSLVAPIDSTNATITDDSALRILNVTSGAGTLTNQYGLYVEDMTAGATADFGIAIEGADTAALWISSAVDTTDAANGIAFGLSRDTNLYRSAANTLKTDDTLTIAAQADIEGYAAIGNGSALSANDTLIVDRTYSISSGEAHGLRVKNNITLTGTATTSQYLSVGINSSVTVNSGTAHALITTVYLSEPKITITSGSVTNSATLYIESVATEATNNYALWVDLGTSRLDNALSVNSGATAAYALDVGSSTSYARGINLAQSGAKTAADYGLYLANTSTSSTDSISKYGAYISSTGTWNGTSANNYGLYIDTASGGTSNFGLAVAAAATQTMVLSADADNTTAAAGIAFGLSRDTNLYRSAANTLATDDKFLAATAGLALDIQNTTDAASNQVAVFGSGNRATPTNNDKGYISFNLDNSAGTQTEFSRLSFSVTDVVSSSKDGLLTFSTQVANTLTDTLSITGGNVGIGTANPSTFKLQVAGNIGPDSAPSTEARTLTTVDSVTSASTGTYPSIYCLSSTDCKIAYQDLTNANLMMADCDDTACSTKTLTTIDSSAAQTGYYASIFCLSSTDCKIAHKDAVAADLLMVDCDDATCATKTQTTVDSVTSANTGNHASIYCISSTDCKISYQDSTNADLMMADCDD
ncbi:MAG: hypothetical protein Q7J73_04270, partial [Dehalococcoidales bacterium]|nr:hypothetical protein [Dehalococcoidales bacterium]